VREKYYKGQKNLIHLQLKVMRARRSVTQKELAARMQVQGVDIDQKAISLIEHNDRVVTDYELACFCKALHCTEQELLQEFHDKLKEWE